MTSPQKRALVTGGAGLIGSHVSDLLRSDGWRVRILGNLEPQTHRHGKPAWIDNDVEFVEGDVTHRETLTAPLSAIYLVFPEVRPIAQLERGDWEVHCPICGAVTSTAPTPECAPVGGETVYGLTKVDQEKLVLLWGKQIGIPTVALRYSCTYGPRQSIFNPYTGVIAIFCTRLLNNLPPVFYEDGQQTRDFSFVEDIARANLLAGESDRLDGLPVNVGSGAGVSIRKIAEQISDALDIRITPEVNNEFRPGEMRHLTSGTERIRAAGYTPQVDLATGIRRYLDWIRQQADVRDYFSEAANILRSKGIVHRVKVGGERGG